MKRCTHFARTAPDLPESRLQPSSLELERKLLLKGVREGTLEGLLRRMPGV